MNIAHCTSTFPKNSETFIINQLNGLLEAGHNIRVFASSRPEDQVNHDALSKHSLRERVTYADPITTYPEGIFALAKHIPYLLQQGTPLEEILIEFTHGKQTPRRVASNRVLLDSKFKPDIYHAHFGSTGVQFLNNTATADTPTVVSFYGSDASRYLRDHPSAYDELFESANAVTCLSEYMREQLTTAGCPRSKLQKIPLCIDTSQFQPQGQNQTSEDSVKLFTAARFVEKKGLEYAIRAVASVETDQEVQYTIAGDGPLRDTLAAITDVVDERDRIRFIGWQSQQKIRTLMQSADLFVLPSVTAQDGDEEGTPTVLLEAQAMELPVISTYHAGIPEIVTDGETGILVPERNVPALTDAVTRLIESPQLRVEYGKEGGEKVQRQHSMERIAGKLTSLYSRIA